MAEHMITVPWTDELLAKAVENNLYYGKHMTFCRRKDDEYVMVKFLAVKALILNYRNLNRSCIKETFEIL